MKKQSSLHSHKDILERAKLVLKIEASEVSELCKKLDKSYVSAIKLLFESTGRVIVTGIGKSGHIGNKISATFASTGTPSFFLHPAEAQHGDLGMVCEEDIILALSYSGETEELCKLAPLFKRLGTKLISITGNTNSTLAILSDVHLNASVKTEACSLNLAPTASTTVALAMGDSLAIVLLEMKGFKADDFARTHPAGTLGRRLLIRVEDIMKTGEALPKVSEEATLMEAVIEMSAKRMGMTCVSNKQDAALGIFTDGDLRRLLGKGYNLQETVIKEVMSVKALTISKEALASEAALLMETKKINHLVVINSKNQLIGAIGLHDLLEAKVV
ncbi:MAG: D-arabinose 5-phosphate isomerase [Betaproteobacteria bacterium TMED82]|nr:MAG: D-arabinose 5-phosphate isomerase [Betaproteobacteria bacterium TMED82]|tara:strand:- start:1669 stop:2661 length:993 start_codon:yes stop_codon:yes gene_type:complete